MYWLYILSATLSTWQWMCHHYSNATRRKYTSMKLSTKSKFFFRSYYFLWRKHENMSPCTGSKVNTNYEHIASWGGCQCWTGEPGIVESPLPPAVVASVLNTRPWPIHTKRIDSRAASHIGYNSESIPGRNDSPLGCLHLALAYRYYFAWKKQETGEHISVHWQQGKYQLWVHCFMRYIFRSNLYLIHDNTVT